jgi:predicted nucleic-acid-binding protein
MRAVDTDILVRILTRDNAAQLSLAEAFIRGGAWVSLLALAETIWVLDVVYARGVSQISGAVEMLLDHTSLTIQDADIVRQALVLYRAQPSLGFSDCLMLELARGAGHLPLGTFDRKLAKVECAQKL